MSGYSQETLREQILTLQGMRGRSPHHSGEESIADEHMSALFWEHGDVSYQGPTGDDPYSGGGMFAFVGRRAQSRCTFPCKFCGRGITFVQRKPFDPSGPHRCLADRHNAGSEQAKEGGAA